MALGIGFDTESSHSAFGINLELGDPDATMPRLITANTTSVTTT